MPDQFGNPLPGETPPLPYGAQVQPGMTGIDTGYVQPLPPVAAPVAPPPQQFNSLGVETNPPAPVAPSAPVAPPAQPAAPPQFVSKPGTPTAQTNPLEVVGYVPGGTSTTVGRTDLGEAGKKAEAALGEAGQAKVEAGKQFAAIQQERADAVALAAAQRGDAAAKADAAIQVHNAKQQQDIAANIADRKRASDDYDRAAADLGPDHFWQVQSTGQKIGNILAIALSGIGNAFSAKAGINARNGALDLINAAIDRDVDMQKTALAAKERGIRTKESLYQTLRQKGADDLSALEYTKAASLAQVDRQLDTAQAKAGTKEAAANLADLQANVKAQQAEHLQRAAEMEAKHVQSTSSSTPILAGQLQQMQAAGQAAQQAEAMKNQGIVPKDPTLATEFGQARDAESFRELAKAKIAFAPAENAVKTLKRLGEKSVLSPTEEAIFNRARTMYSGWLKGNYALQLGVLSESDKAFMDDAIPTRKAWELFSGRAKAVTDAMEKDFNDSKKALGAYTVRTQ